VSTWAIVVGGGSGSRFGAAKQFTRLGGVTVLDRSVAGARAACDGVVVVIPAGAAWEPPDGVATTVGGDSRSASVRAGLAAVPDEATVIVVHDAARPLASRALYAAVVGAVQSGADAAIPALPVSDTIKRVDGDRVVDTVAREDLVIVQTPQAFAAGALRGAHASGAVGTDDAALVEAAGGTVVTVPGEPRNVKLTVSADLELAQALLDTGAAP
jgi:2-C-methyl-D-erythritol 4-phosphate cytidylyltransferase